MSDIFISYRHGETDTWIAGRLHDSLEESFAVFLDTGRQSTDYGDDFAERIDEALETCRVLFIVVGPDWSSEEGIRRLSQDGDWVRYELRAALGRQGIRIVPLFVGKGASQVFASLADEWLALKTRIGRPLNPDLWGVEVQDLSTRLRNEWLAAQRGDAHQIDDTVPDVLPYLCDRTDQVDDLAEIVKAMRGPMEPIACVVHGYKDEAHDELLDRLRHGRALEEILGAPDVGTITKPLQISRDRLREGRFADALKSGLKGALLNRRAASDDDLRTFFVDLPQPLVVVLQLTWSDFEAIGEGLMRGLVEAWKALPREGQQNPARQPQYPTLLWINFTYDEVDAELSRELLAQPLRKLPPVEEGHVREWVGLDEVKPHVERRKKKNELLDLPGDARYYFTPGKVHMRRFADGVRKIMSSPERDTRGADGA